MAFENFLASSFLVLGASMSPPAADNAAVSPNQVQVASNTVQGAQLLTHNTPTEVNGVETVCTGIDSDTRKDPRWAAYPLRLEFAAGNRAYVSNETVNITNAQGSVLHVQCPGAWVLAKLPAGKYSVTASVEGTTKTASVNVPRTGQARVVMHFPEVPAAESDGSMGPNAPAPEPQYEPVNPSSH